VPLQIGSIAAHRQDTVNFNSTSGKQPYVLSVSANTTTQLTGQIFVNGVVVRQIKQNKTLINLSTYLSKSQRLKFQVIINLHRLQSWLNFQALTQVTQQTGGNGMLQTLIMIAIKHNH